MELVKKPFNKVVRYLREVKIEMKRVNWLHKREVLNHTILVLAIAVATAIFLGGLDLFFQWFLGKFIL